MACGLLGSLGGNDDIFGSLLITSRFSGAACPRPLQAIVSSFCLDS